MAYSTQLETYEVRRVEPSHPISTWRAVGKNPVPGEITCKVIKCPNCGTRLKICYQALAPEYLIEDAKCPKCGTVVAHWVLSIEEAPFPVGQIIGGIAGAVIFAFIAKKRPEFITQFISIPVGAATGAMIGKVLSGR